MSKLDRIQDELVVTLCSPEKCFPHSFFDIILHLTMHLTRDVRLCGPSYLRWMYPFERFMNVLKGYVWNHNCLEGCIIECYIEKETLEFCTQYLSDIDAIGIPNARNDECKGGKPLPGCYVATINYKLLLQARYYVFENTTTIKPYIK